MTSYPIRLQTGSILAISKALETLESSRSDALDLLLAGLDPDEYRAFMVGRSRLASAAQTLLNAERAGRHSPAPNRLDSTMPPLRAKSISLSIRGDSNLA
jgi:hypothetical protein